MLGTYLQQALESVRTMDLGERIKQARKDKGWRQKHLAAAVHVEPITVSRWERGQHMPGLETLELIARETEKPLSYFLEEPESIESDRLSAIEVQLQRILDKLDET